MKNYKWLDFVRILRDQKQLWQWRVGFFNGIPPQIVKQKAIRRFKHLYNYSILIETGTYLGDMVQSQKRHFKRIHSVELSESLYIEATQRFKDDGNVFLYLGDSGVMLELILQQVNEPCIIWLDGHYSGGFTAKGEKECPVMEELNVIFSDKRFDHVVLIDDARCFTGEGDYPSKHDIMEFVAKRRPDYDVEVKDDIIHLTPSLFHQWNAKMKLKK